MRASLREDWETEDAVRQFGVPEAKCREFYKWARALRIDNNLDWNMLDLLSMFGYLGNITRYRWCEHVGWVAVA